MALDNTLKLLSNSFARFNTDYNRCFPLIQSTANNYKNDFSLLCKQDYIDALGIFPAAKFEIQTLLEEYLNEAKDIIDKETYNELCSELNNLKTYDFKELLYSYVNVCNTFITLMKIPSINSFEKKYELAQPVLTEWEKYMNAVNSFVETIKNLSSIFNNLTEGE